MKGLGCLLGGVKLTFLGMPEGLSYPDGASTSSLKIGDTLFFGADEGAIYFNAAEVAEKLNERFLLGNERQWSVLVEAYVNGVRRNTRSTRFKIDEKEYLQFKVSASDNLYSDILTYRYAVLGEEEKKKKVESISTWKPVKEDNLIRLIKEGDLGYGDNYLYIQAKSKASWKNKKIIIRVKRPFYLLPWFWIFLLFLGFSSFYFGKKTK